jgi:hypothetical protein
MWFLNVHHLAANSIQIGQPKKINKEVLQVPSGRVHPESCAAAGCSRLNGRIQPCRGQQHLLLALQSSYLVPPSAVHTFKAVCMLCPCRQSPHVHLAAKQHFEHAEAQQIPRAMLLQQRWCLHAEKSI